jgi:RNA polymerase sigma factor (sigma-70 family)
MLHPKGATTGRRWKTYMVRNHDLREPNKNASDAAGSAIPGDHVMAVLVGNRRAFLRFLRRRVDSHEMAEDLLQDAFGKALEKIEMLRDDESAVAWFYRTLRNSVIDHYRRTGTSARALEALASELDPTVAPPELRREVCACVSRLAATLKPEYAEALEHVDIGGATVKAYAETQGLSPNTAGVRVHRARQALRKQVLASCGTCAEHGCVDCHCQRRPHAR